MQLARLVKVSGDFDSGRRGRRAKCECENSLGFIPVSLAFLIIYKPHSTYNFQKSNITIKRLKHANLILGK